MQPTCPYHHLAECAPVHRVPSAGPECATLACGFPARICPRCGTAGRTLARFCRECALHFQPHTFAAETRGAVHALWQGARRGEEPVSYAVQLPAGSGRVGVVASAWGFLFLGTSASRVLVLSALLPERVLTTVSVPGEVLALEPAPHRDEAPPTLVVTTPGGVFRLPFLPTPRADPLWNGDEGAASAAPAVPVGDGVLGFRKADGQVEAVWIPWGPGARPPRAVSGLFAGPAGQPLPLGADRVFFYGKESVHLFHGPGGAPASVQSAELALVPEVAYPASYERGSDEILYVYRRAQEYGVARLSPASLVSPQRCTEPVYSAVQVLAIDRGAVCVASDRDLEILSPVTGERKWSLRGNLHIDNLNLAEFQPVRTEGYLLLLGRTGGGGDSLYLMPLSNEGLGEGPRRIATVGRAALRPLVIPGGVVCVARPVSGTGSTLLVVHAPRKEDA